MPRGPSGRLARRSRVPTVRCGHLSRVGSIWRRPGGGWMGEGRGIERWSAADTTHVRVSNLGSMGSEGKRGGSSCVRASQPDPCVHGKARDGSLVPVGGGECMVSKDRGGCFPRWYARANYELSSSHFSGSMFEVCGGQGEGSFRRPVSTLIYKKYHQGEREGRFLPFCAGARMCSLASVRGGAYTEGMKRKEWCTLDARSRFVWLLAKKRVYPAWCERCGETMAVTPTSRRRFCRDACRVAAARAKAKTEGA